MSAPVYNHTATILYDRRIAEIEKNGPDIFIRVSHISKEKILGSLWNESSYIYFFASISKDIEALEKFVNASNEFREDPRVIKALESEKQLLSYISRLHEAKFLFDVFGQVIDVKDVDGAFSVT